MVAVQAPSGSPAAPNAAGTRAVPDPGELRMGRHSPDYLAQQRRRTIELVDHRGIGHRVTIDAAADGLPRGRYTTECSEVILPGALVAQMARWCPLCAPIPAQRRTGR
jgi:hypothetical protein